MASFLSSIILPIAVAAVAFVLLLGLINMMRGGSPNRSQNLMRLRVLLQFVAIVITMLAVWAMGRLKEEDAWSSSIASIPGPAMTAPPRSAAASAARNTICASPPMAPSTRPMPRSAWCGCIWLMRPNSMRMLGLIQNDLFDLGADLAVPQRDGKAERLRMLASQVERLERDIDA